MKKELASKYDHKSVEKGKYQHWLEKEYFKAGDVSKKPYAIVRTCLGYNFTRYDYSL